MNSWGVRSTWFEFKSCIQPKLVCAKLCRKLVQSVYRNALFKVKRHAVLLNGRPRGNLKIVTDFPILIPTTEIEFFR